MKGSTKLSIQDPPKLQSFWNPDGDPPFEQNVPLPIQRSHTLLSGCGRRPPDSRGSFLWSVSGPALLPSEMVQFPLLSPAAAQRGQLQAEPGAKGCG